MRLGSETGSLINHVMTGPSAIVPTVGMGVTICMWSDRHAGTVVRVSPSGKTLWYQEDTAIRIDSNGMSEMQDYAYTPNSGATVEVARLNKRGQWKSAGRGVTLDSRRAYYDFSF
jgi:hypothetical protein